MPKSSQEPQSEAPTTSNRQERIDYLIARVEAQEGEEKQIAEMQAEVDRLDAITDAQFDEELEDEETFSEDEATEGEVEVTTTTSSPTQAPTLQDVATAPTQEIDPETGKPYSAYKARLRKLNRDALGAEIPLELADMIRAAAKKAGDIATTAFIRLAWADAVNAAGLTRETTNAEGVVSTEPWVFDKKTLEITTARQSTRGLTDEEKEKKAAQVKAAAQDQRSLIKFLLAEHKVKTGVPLTAVEVEVLKANNATDLLAKMKLIG